MAGLEESKEAKILRVCHREKSQVQGESVPIAIRHGIGSDEMSQRGWKGVEQISNTSTKTVLTPVTEEPFPELTYLSDDDATVAHFPMPEVMVIFPSPSNIIQIRQTHIPFHIQGVEGPALTELVILSCPSRILAWKDECRDASGDGYLKSHRHKLCTKRRKRNQGEGTRGKRRRARGRSNKVIRKEQFGKGDSVKWRPKLAQTEQLRGGKANHYRAKDSGWESAVPPCRLNMAKCVKMKRKRVERILGNRSSYTPQHEDPNVVIAIQGDVLTVDGHSEGSPILDNLTGHEAALLFACQCHRPGPNLESRISNLPKNCTSHGSLPDSKGVTQEGLKEGARMSPEAGYHLDTSKMTNYRSDRNAVMVRRGSSVVSMSHWHGVLGTFISNTDEPPWDDQSNWWFHSLPLSLPSKVWPLTATRKSAKALSEGLDFVLHPLLQEQGISITALRRHTQRTPQPALSFLVLSPGDGWQMGPSLKSEKLRVDWPSASYWGEDN
ncbi:hypothetical protein BC826DRAFT_966935 [Russula brevipes]|nr:hypothetical protein BC826DRAFT_966935 [Russula brevipes]